MSSEYFGLIMDPFESGPDPRFLYMDGGRRNVFAQLLSSVYECKGLVLLACRRGLGKSALVRHLSDQLASLDSVLMLYPGGVLSCRPGMTFADVLAACRGRLDRRNKDASDEERLPATLEQAAARGQAAVLILDDADALDDAALVRLVELCEPDADDRRALSVIVVGSAQVGGRLDRLGVRGGRTGAADLQLDLAPLRDRDIDRMVRHRLTVAGLSDGDLFSPVALAEVARRSRGEPLRIVTICAGALALAEQERKPTVSRDLVERAADRVGEFDEPQPAAAAGEATSARAHARDVNVAAEPPPYRLPEPDTGPLAEPEGRRPVRRLDDVAEAIRAADRRSTSGADPHIRYAPAPSRPAAEREPYPSAEEHTLTPETRGFPERGMAERGMAERGMSDQAYALYPGIRPSETRPARRRSGLGAVLTVGLLLALLAAGGAYAVRSGWVDVGSIPNALQAAVDRVVHMVGSLIKSDPTADESIAGISPGTPGTPGTGAGTGGAGSADLGFGRFGTPPGREDVRAPERYDFAPPPPQAGDEPGAAEPPGGRSDAGDIGAAPVAAAPAAPSPQAEAPAPGQGSASAAVVSPPPGGPQAPPANEAAPADADVAALSVLRPPETKPSPPPQQPQASQPAQPSPAAASRQVPPRDEPVPPRPDAARTQQNEPLLARGDEYLGTGDLDMARTFYQMAFERGSAEAAIRMGWTFDPQYFQRIGLRGEASPREAILWYQEALRRGSSQASSRLSDLATWLQSAAASGDLEAQRILRMWQG